MNRFIRKKIALIAKITIITPIVIVVIAVLFFFCMKWVMRYIAVNATVEVGNTFSASDFILEEGHTVQFADEFAARFVQDGIAKINHIGKYSVGLVVDGKDYNITLTVQDTIPPKASPRMVIMHKEDLLTAEQCVTDIKDRTDVSCTFKTKPDLTKVGVVNEIVVLTDEAGNDTEIPVTIKIVDERNFRMDQYTIEAGGTIPSELLIFNQVGKYVTDISAINTSLIGTYPLELEVEGVIHSIKLIIEDTIAPTATIEPIMTYFGSAFPPAKDFVSEIVDEGPVTISYETKPDQIVNEQTMVRIVLTDQAGNRTVYNSRCYVLSDDEAPKFVSFPKELDVKVNSKIIWRALVSAEDNSGKVELSLDAKGADLNKTGTYTIYFIAKDPAGNETRQEAKLTVHKELITREMMDEVCAEITDKIIKEGMTTQEKLYAVYKYVSTKIRYTSDGDHDDVLKEAYLGLTSRKSGDCFTFCAASKELLSYLGYESQIVKRKEDFVKESGNHFWLLVNCGTEEEPLWYHHDSCPHSGSFKREIYMMTDAQLIAYTNYLAKNTSRKHYYTFDTSLHPASATEIVVDLEIDEKYFE